MEYEAGPWKMQWRKESSNVREAENLTDRIERLGRDMVLTNHEVFVMTDNTAFEGAYYKGHSPSAKLNDIVFRLHKAKRDGGFVLYVLHISGKRMKATGVDGLSRGNIMEGILAGAPETMFDLKDMQAARLWVVAPAVMETALELFGHDRLAHPQWPHVFVIPHLMTYMWRKNSGKDADVLFTIPAGIPFLDSRTV